MTKKDQSAKNAMLIGAGVAALTAAGIYFFGPKGKAHRNKLKGWMIRMKGDIIERMEDVKEMSEGAYHDIIDKVSNQYKKHEKIAEEDIQELADELKRQWKDIATTGVRNSGRRRSASSRTQTKGAAKRKSRTK